MHKKVIKVKAKALIRDKFKSVTAAHIFHIGIQGNGNYKIWGEPSKVISERFSDDFWLDSNQSISSPPPRPHTQKKNYKNKYFSLVRLLEMFGNVKEWPHSFSLVKEDLFCPAVYISLGAKVTDPVSDRSPFRGELTQFYTDWSAVLIGTRVIKSDSDRFQIEISSWK